MAQYTGMILTKKGRLLQAKAEAGATLSFTRIKIGDGQIGQGQSLEDLNDLVAPIKSLNISSVEAEGDGLCRIRTNITNDGVAQGFYVRELGLFATDPDNGEILYAITTATAPDYLPPEGGATVVNNQFDIIVIIGNASSITATISPSGLVRQEEFDAHLSDHDNPHDVTPAKIGAETPAGSQAKVDTHANKATGAHKASAISIEDAGEHFAASNVEGALAEVFTSVGDGKALVATAITDMGGTVAGTAPHSFQELANGVRSVNLVGKKFASGTVTSSGSYDGVGYQMTLRGLAFRPGVVILQRTESSYDYHKIYNANFTGAGKYDTRFEYRGGANGGSYSPDLGGWTIYGDGFGCRMGSPNTMWFWWAYE